MKVIIIPTEEEILAKIPRRAGVTIKLNKNELEVTGLDQLEEDTLSADIKQLYGKTK